MAPHLIFGTSTLGMDMTEFQDAESVKSLLGHLEELGIDRLDTAARYPPFKPGRSEQLLGEANASAANFLIDTKIYTDTSTDGSGDLTREAVEKSVNASFKRLRENKGGQRVVRAPPRHKARTLTRSAGGKLLAAGFRTGKLVNNEHADTRLSDSNPLGKIVQHAYRSEDLRHAMKRFDAAVKAEGLTATEVALRWVAYHSALGGGDAIILGASKTAQIRESVSRIRKGGLSPQLIGMAEEIWEAARTRSSAPAPPTTSGIPVLDADYRKAPEHPFPAALHDVEDVLHWVGGRSSLPSGEDGYRLDASRVVLSGFSSGGALALAAASAFRREILKSSGVGIRGVVALYPLVDLTIPSKEKLPPREGISPMDPRVLDLFVDCYLPDRGDRVDPRASPGKADPAEYPGTVGILSLSTMLMGVGHGFDAGVEQGTLEWETREEVYALALETVKGAIRET
ncbi:putative carboxylesterase 15 [Cytospora mali]|uniref:Carboxylesterase 15 n=1 Tax=Cytospora mali TaxID=578113 RepID=A0A194VUP0_CYTMA|nr:putative carboxylesterase 15 [Valsa mali]